MFFDDWFSEKMLDNGYKLTAKDDLISRVWLTYQDGYDALSKDTFRVVYLRSEMSPEDIHICFTSNIDTHLLFVIDVRAMPLVQVSDMPKWIRVLHALYYGRIYIYEDLYERIKAVHIDWNTEVRHYSPPIELDGILFTDTDCKLRDFPGVFHIARFYDKAFWKEQEKPKGESPREKASREKWDRFNQRQQRKTEDDVYEAFKRAFEEHMRNHNAYEPPRPRSKSSPVGDKWLQGFINTGNLAAARTLYKQLAKEFHPDLNPGKPQALETMQAINIAFDRVKDVLR